MAINYSYPIIDEVQGDDLILLADASKQNQTKSASVSQLASYINLGGSQNSVKTIQLTSEQLISFNGGETIELVKAPGADKVISIISIVGFLDFNSTVYNFNQNLTISIGSNTQSTLFTTQLNASADEYFTLDNQGGGTSSILIPNVSLDLKSSASATVTTGNSTLTLNILYRIVDFS